MLSSPTLTLYPSLSLSLSLSLSPLALSTTAVSQQHSFPLLKISEIAAVLSELLPSLKLSDKALKKPTREMVAPYYEFLTAYVHAACWHSTI